MHHWFVYETHVPKKIYHEEDGFHAFDILQYTLLNKTKRIEWLIHTLLNHHFECIHMIEISSLFFVVARKRKMKVLLHKNQHLQY
jgi:hypothetical protein